MSLMRRIGRVVVWGCAIILLLKCHILLHMRGNWILGDNGGIWFLSLRGPSKVVPIYLTSVKIINFCRNSNLLSSYVHRNFSPGLWARLSPVLWGATIVAGVRSRLCFLFHRRWLRVWRIGRRISSITLGGVSVMLSILLSILLRIADEALTLGRLKLLGPLSGHRDPLGRFCSIQQQVCLIKLFSIP